MSGLLDGVRVVDLAGPAIAYAGRMLVDLGADVVLVEPPGGSRARRLAPLAATPSGGTISAHFAYMAAGKRVGHARPHLPGRRSAVAPAARVGRRRAGHA